MIIDRYRIGDILKVKITPALPVWNVEVVKFNESDPNNIRLDVVAVDVPGKKPPFTSAILDADRQVLEFIKHGDIPYDQGYEKRYKELVNALKVIQKHLS